MSAVCVVFLSCFQNWICLLCYGRKSEESSKDCRPVRLLKTFHIKPLQSIKSGLNHTHTHTVFELFKEKHMAKGAGGVVCNCLSKTWNVINDLGAQIIKELFSFKVNKKSKLTFWIHVTFRIVHDSSVLVIQNKIKSYFLHSFM